MVLGKKAQSTLPTPCEGSFSTVGWTAHTVGWTTHTLGWTTHTVGWTTHSGVDYTHMGWTTHTQWVECVAREERLVEYREGYNSQARVQVERCLSF